MELLGYDVRWRKLVAFVVSAALAGLAGALFASWGNFINPEVFSLPQAAIVVIWVLVGGRGTYVCERCQPRPRSARLVRTA